MNYGLHFLCIGEKNGILVINMGKEGIIMAKNITSGIKALNAPKKITWLISLIAAIIGLILWIIGLCCKINVIAIIGPILLAASAALLLLSGRCKNL